MRIRTGCMAVLLLLVGSRASAEERDPTTSEQASIERGTKLRREHRDAEALVEFQRAFALGASPRALAQMALAEQALGRWLDAERHLSEALLNTDNAWIASRAELLRGSLESIQGELGFLLVETNLSEAVAWVNGASLGRLPMQPLRVVAGPIDIEVRVEGRQPVTRSSVVPARGTLIERIEFVDQSAPTPLAPLVARRVPILVTRPSAPSHALQRTLGWAFAGAAAVSLGGAIVAQLFQQQSAARYNDDRRCLTGDLSRDQRCGLDRGAAETAQTYANLGYIAAVALGAGAGVLLLTLPAPRAGGQLNVSIDSRASGLQLGYQGSL